MPDVERAGRSRRGRRARRVHGDLRIFHADVEGPLSERPAAEDLARHLGLDLAVAPVRDRDFVDAIPDVVAHYGAPFVNPTLIPIFRVSRLVHEHGVKAVLTGEAADECYLGYPWLAPNLPNAARRAAGRLLSRLHLGPDGSDTRGVLDHDLVAGLSNGFEVRRGPVEFAAETVAEPYQSSSTPGLTGSGELSYILRTLLYRNDTMGMASGIECRFPFLDRRLVSLSAHLPRDCKLRMSPFAWDPKHPFYRDKWIIREIATRYLPKRLSHRKKGMFPTNAFRRMQVADGFFQESFTAEFFRLSRSRLQSFLDQAHGPLRLRLMLLESWAHRCVRGCPAQSLAARLSAHVQVAPQGVSVN
ncbi:MAG: asparagine synthase C-terminal domain-containing protein [Gemmatimonadota bacterium]